MVLDFGPKRQSKGQRAASHPRLALRVAVTGTRTLKANKVDELRRQVNDVLDFVRTHTARLAKREAAANFYAGGADAVPMMRLLSPLARGADRLVAQVALDLGYSLYVPMPFRREEYEKDFTGVDPAKNRDAVPLSAEQDLAEFRVLLERAGDHWFPLDGDHEDQNRAYENVGRFVVRHCDLLIAIWDGKPAAGRGGAAEIVEFAAANGVPVWWLHATEKRPPAWITRVQDLRDCLETPQSLPDRERSLSEEAETGGTPAHGLTTYLDRQFEPPSSIPRHCHSWLEWLARLHQKPEASLEAEYFGQSPGLLRGLLRSYGRLYGLVMRSASGCSPPSTSPRRPSDSVAAYWFSLYQPTDTRASEYAALYRSTYICLFFMATAAVMFGAAAALVHAYKPLLFVMVGLELTALFCIALSVLAAIRGGWHERSIDYRLLAELCRKQQVLAPLGRAVSLGALRRAMLRRMAGEERTSQVSGSDALEVEERTGWVAWIFALWERAAPLPRGDIAEALPVIIREDVLEGLIEEQLQYHRDRMQMASRADETFFRVGDWSFRLVLIFVILKLFIIGGLFSWFGWKAMSWLGWNETPNFAHGLLNWLAYPVHVLSEVGFGFLTWFTIILPAVSAAAFGIRSYAELQLLVEQSNHMQEELLAAKRSIGQVKLRIERKACSPAFAADDLASDMQTVTKLMLQDLEGWARLFIGKPIEP